MPSVVYRFTRDLRLDDHAGLATAAAQGRVVPVLIVDALLEKRLTNSPRRAAYYCAAVAALDDALRERGSSLIVRRGKPGPLLKAIARDCDADTVAWSASFDAAGMHQDRTTQSQLEEAGIRALIVQDAPAIAPEETSASRSAAGEGYRAFVPYYAVWRELTPASYEAPLLLAFAAPQLASDPLPQAAQFGSDLAADSGGAAQARAKFEAFLQGPALQYAFALTAPADEATSHLGADLSFGTIAARTVVRRARARLEDPFLLAEERSSLRLFLRSVALRDFFLQLLWYCPHTQDAPLQEKMQDFPFARDHARLEAWRTGHTGFPLVDAGIRQLHETGWMHPRVRAVAASFLCFDLGVDWRVGAAYWDRLLIEDDPALAVGNWQWIAGVGADLAAFPRIYNPRKQARRFDPNALYAKRWIPEIAHLTPAAIGAASPAERPIELPLFAERAYPAPIVDHEAAARSFLRRYREFTG